MIHAELPPLAARRADTIIGRMSGARVLVIGDVMLDHFLIGRVSRISPEAPVPVVAYERDEFRAGGAANVALNAGALGARVELVGLIGQDDAAARLHTLLQSAQVPTNGLITDQSRRTTTKVRIVTTRNQQVTRVDYETDAAMSAAIGDAVADQITARVANCSVVIVSDYAKGTISRGVMATAVAAAHEAGVPLLVDPKLPHLDFYTGATLVTPNHLEAEAVTHLRIRTTADAERAAKAFRERARCDGVLITRGEHGMWLSCEGIAGHLPATAREVADVTGAGDSVVATLAAAMAAGASITEAAQLANYAAGIVVGKWGVAAVTPAELRAAFTDLRLTD